ncbi:MAG: hypothetical protein WC796_01790 [Candidatus Pacearchaeota archaeon]|jgi:hypothetical protein
MVLPNYQQLVEKIAKASGLTVDEIDRKVEAKCAKLSGLISKEGSAQIVASELGISFEKEKLKISELLSGMKRVNITGKVIDMAPIREYNKNGKSGKIAAMTIADETGNIRTVLWDTNHIALFEDGKIKREDTVEISNAAVRNDELHLSGFSDIKLSKESMLEVKVEKRVIDRKLSEIKAGDNAKIRAVMTQIFEPKFFEVCPECSKKATDNTCAEHGSVLPVKKALIGVVLDDGSENVRGIVFNDQIKMLGITSEELENPEFFVKKKEELLGKEAVFYVNVRNNKLFNTPELIINSFEEINLDNLIQSLKTN